MNAEDKITLSQWNQLSQNGKEKLKRWAFDNNYELDIVPGDSGSFDPSCDYAALLTNKQIIIYINQNSKKTYKTDGWITETLWKKALGLVERE